MESSLHMKFANGAIQMLHGEGENNLPADRIHIHARSIEDFKINGNEDAGNADRNTITFCSSGVQFFIREEFVRLLSDIYQALQQSRAHDAEEHAFADRMAKAEFETQTI